MLPARAGQPTQAQVHITLAQLRDMPGASDAEAAWRAAAAAEHGWLRGPDADAAACDATLAPMVTGHVDPTALDRMVEVFLTVHGLNSNVGLPGDGGRHGPDSGHDAPPCGCQCGGCTCPGRKPLSAETLTRLRGSLLALAADALSGPGGLASWLRHTLVGGGPAASPSLPLDVPLPRTPAKPSQPSPPTCAGPRPPAIRGVRSPAVICPPACARSTM